uniref:Uncharacterized protein n=2 Tax=Clastoptera arizonana TaxID=38151 RepID=A0A1B6CMI3_9HEMI
MKCRETKRKNNSPLEMKIVKTLVLINLLIVSEVCFTAAYFCSTEAEFSNPCKYGNMTLTTLKRHIIDKERCDNFVHIADLAGPPIIGINWPNRTELFTVLMLDAGKLGAGPYYLQWLVTNVTAEQLTRFALGTSKILAQYETPTIPASQTSPQYYQVVAYRQNSTLRSIPPQIHTTYRRTFDVRKWLDGIQEYVKLCGPVAGIQIRSNNEQSLSNNPNSPGYVYQGSINYPPAAPGWVAQNPPPAPGWAPPVAQVPTYVDPNHPVPPAPGWVPQNSGNQGQTSWASSGSYAPNEPPKKKSKGSILRPEALVLLVLFVVTLKNLIRY